jgi:hypothetical protein
VLEIRVRSRYLVVALAGLLVLAACSSGDDGAAPAADNDDGATTTTARPRPDVPAADVEGPIAGEPANRMPVDFADRYGFVEEEYLVSGDASAYEPVGDLTDDGAWSVGAGATAPYKTRVIVRRPADPDDFNGTVVVEWFNVTAGVDADPDFGLLYPALFDEGAAYVGVSAQHVSVEGGTGPLLEIPGAPASAFQPLKDRDPERYGSLSHPGDEYSYDIYAQVGAAVRLGDLLDGVAPEHVLAIGESQSAFRMVTFINAIQPVTEAYDGFLVHSRGGGSAPLAGDQGESDPSANPVAIRGDLDVPVLQFQTETDLIELGFLAARQPDTDLLATWEVAGTAHADAAILAYGALANDIDFDLGAICGSVNEGPQAEVLRAAFVVLQRWVADGTAPPAGPPIETADATLRRDADGNVIGGIRTPAVDAPVAALSGSNATDSVICRLFGATDPFTPERLAELYATHDDYVEAVTASADAALEAGFLREADRDALVTKAEAARIPG